MKKGISIVFLLCFFGTVIMFQGCKKPTVPALTTTEVSQIAPFSAVSGGTIISDGGEVITEKGVCWSSTTLPTITDLRTSDGSGSSSFTSTLIGLEEGTPYYVRAYATNNVGTAYGNEIIFTTSLVTAAVLTTTEVSSVTPVSALAGGNVTDAGGGTITARGVCWGTSTGPTTAGNKTVDGTGTGIFTSNLTGLENGTVYYYRAYATNSSGTSYGSQYQFITPVEDIDGNVYQTVKIGSQVWMAENLKTLKLNNGSSLSGVTDNTSWSLLGSPAYCFYDNNSSNKAKYGVLYNWYTVTTDMLCPSGWKVPTRQEWQTLVSYLGGAAIAGGKMKLEGTDFWASPNLNATNAVGFNAKPGGFRNPYDGTFSEEQTRGWWWSSTDGVDYIATAFMAVIWNDTENILVAEANERNGIYVRCIKSPY
jgi:uncharacterized protein (TIGR02145 family)